MTNFYIFKESTKTIFSKKRVSIYISTNFDDHDNDEEYVDYYDPSDYDTLADLM